MPASADTQLSGAVQLIKTGRYSEALVALDRLKQAAPQNGELYFYAGVALAQRGRLSDAALELREAVRLAPVRLEFRVFQANIEAQLKQNGVATAALSPLKDPQVVRRLDAAWLQLLADTWYRIDQFDDALNVLNILSGLHPGDGAVDFQRGKIYIVQARQDAAVAAFRASIAKSRDNPEAYFELGKLLYQQNHLVEARDALERALRQDADNAEYLYKLGMVCLAAGDTKAATSYLERAKPAAGQLPEIYFALARAYQQLGNYDRAEEYRHRFRDTISAQREAQEDARAVDKLVAQGQRKLDEGKPAEARALFEQAVHADPRRWDAHAYLAEMYLSAGDLGSTDSHLKAMQEIDPESIVGDYLASRYWFRRGDYEQARAFAEKVRLSQPANPDVRRLLGDIYLALGNKKRAQEEYRAALQFAADASPSGSAQLAQPSAAPNDPQ